MEKEKLIKLYSSEDLQKRVKELGERITQDYKGKELVIIGVLKGSFIFMADLIRHINMDITCEFVQTSSYRDKMTSGKLDFLLDVDPKKIESRHVILIEDIVDTGKTVSFLLKHLKKYKPESLKICSLLFKEEMLVEDIIPDYVGFKIDPKFVVGYGLDVAGKLRNLDSIKFVQND